MSGLENRIKHALESMEMPIDIPSGAPNTVYIAQTVTVNNFGRHSLMALIDISPSEFLETLRDFVNRSNTDDTKTMLLEIVAAYSSCMHSGDLSALQRSMESLHATAELTNQEGFVDGIREMRATTQTEDLIEWDPDNYI